jgi:hypothetical protein
MRRVTALAGAVLVAVSGAPAAGASGDEWGMNGTYQVSSLGHWAKTNDVFRDEAPVLSKWTVTTTCSTPVECTGRVVSDQGWSADVNLHGSEYVVKRDIPNWEPCSNGPARTGHQIYRFYPVDENGLVAWGSTVFAGIDITSGDSGACGINQPLVVSIPLRLEKAG